jgi:hypothetical protein
VNAEPALRPSGLVGEQSGAHRRERSGGRAGRRVIVLAGRAEAARLCRNPLVLAALVIAAALIWWNSRAVVPIWWVWDVQIGSTLLVVAGATLMASQLAAGRVRRDGAERLYESYPTPAAARTVAHLLGLVGPLVLAAVLAGAAVGWLDSLGSVGSPRPAVLVQGLLLIALGGATGVALGSWLPSGMAGILAVIVLGAAETDLVFPFGGPVRLPGGTAWLFPWNQPTAAGWLPGPTQVIPPASHLAWLATLTGLAAVAALWRVIPDRRPRPARRTRRRPTRLAGWTGLTALATAGCLAVAGWSGWAQTRPVPLSVQDSLLYRAAHPAQVEPCTGQHGVRYCAYPSFRSDVGRWATVVNGVLNQLPKRPATALVVHQLVDSSFAPSDVGYLPVALAGNHRLNALANDFSRFLRHQSDNSRLVPGSSMPPVYVDLAWGRGPALGWFQLGLALQVGWWVAHLPTTWRRNVLYNEGPNVSGLAQVSCLAVGQAREAVALWLAAGATPAARTAFLAKPPNYVGPAGPGYFTPNKVNGRWIASYEPATFDFGYAPALVYTGQGADLAKAMLALPDQRVRAVLSARWPGWLSPQATDAQLAAALGIALPAATSPPRSDVNRGQPADSVCR